MLLGPSGGSFAYSGTAAPPFSLSWDELDPLEPGSGELLRLEGKAGSQSLTVSALEPFLPSGGSAEPLPVLGLAAERARDEIEREYPGARVVLEGRTELAVDRGPEAYQLAFAAPAAAAGETLIGKRLLVPDPDRPGQGVEIEITELTSRPAVVEKVEGAPSGFFANWPIQLLLEAEASVRTEEGLETPLRSFAFG
ncbi:MAG: hypothetical protein ACR2OC_02615 [Solirubrobacterales bacterium]